jgi:GT2 family glycosyltransferase
VSQPSLTIGIPTCGRPQAIAACLESIQRHVDVPHRVIVLDSLVTEEAFKTYARHPTVTAIGLESPVGPSEARRRISDAADSDLLLYLDDDNLVTPGAVRTLIAHLEQHPDVGIAAGGWRENGSLEKRALGQFFHFGRVGDRMAVYKTFLTMAEARAMELASVRVDAVLATMMIRRDVLERAAFDPRYDFFYELYDFFMQCRTEAIQVEVLPDVIFEHRPLPYQGTTRRQTGQKSDDQRRFAEKWGVEPIGRVGL